MNYKGTPVYLRDLRDELQADIKRSLSGEALRASVEDEDVVVGYYVPSGKEYPANKED